MSAEMVPVFFGSGMIGAGMIMVFFAIKNFKKANEVSCWPTATGHIQKLEATGLNKMKGEAGAYQHRRYIVDLVYKYQVEGEKYVGKKFFFGSDVTMRSEVKEVFSLFKDQTDVIVYYNPKNPEEAVLMKERLGGKNHADLWGGLLTIGVGLLAAMSKVFTALP